MTENPRRALLTRSGTAGAAALAAALLTPRPLSASTVRRPHMFLLRTYIAGVRYEGDAAAAAALRPGDALDLRRNAGCAYDAQTVEVWSPAGVRLGRLPRIQIRALVRLMDAGLRAGARVGTILETGPQVEVYIEQV